MFQRFSVNFSILSIILDMVLTFCALSLAVVTRPFLPPFPFLIQIADIRIPTELYFITPILWVFAFFLSSVYDPKRIYKIVDEFLNVVLATGLAALLFAGLLYLGFRDFSRWLFIEFILISLFFSLGWRTIVRIIFKFTRFPTIKQRVLIVGAGEVGKQVGKIIQKNHLMGLQLIGYLDDDVSKNGHQIKILGNIASAHRIVVENKIDDVVIALPQRAYSQLNNLAATLHELPVQVRAIPDYFSLALYRATAEDFGGIPMINLRDPALNSFQRLVKRIFDLIIGSIITIFVLPLFGLIALAIKSDSAGSVIFRQDRVGDNGHVFRMYKFRTMVSNAESLQASVNTTNENGDIVHKSENDPRITRIGRFLRRTSIDELPQLFNVLKGDMSLVGPRPEMPWLVEKYEPWQRKRFAVPQGMTGWWQINGRSNKLMHLNTEDDLYYIQNYSLWLDIYILLKTPLVILRGTGAH